MEPSLSIKLVAGRCTLTLAFDADPAIDKPDLAKGVIDHHLCGQASRLALILGEVALHGREVVEARYADEIAAKQAEVDARKRGFGTLSSDVQPTAKPE